MEFGGVALVTHFEPRLVQSKLLKNVNSLEEAESYIDSKMKLHSYRGLEIPELSFELLNGKKKSYFWVGQKSYSSLSKAKSAMDVFAKKLVKQGVNFDSFVKELLENGVPFEEPEELILEEGDDLYGGALNIEEAVALYVWEKMDLQRYSGKNADGLPLTQEVRSLLCATYLRPLRDAEREMSAGRGSRLSQILQHYQDS